MIPDTMVEEHRYPTRVLVPPARFGYNGYIKQVQAQRPMQGLTYYEPRVVYQSVNSKVNVERYRLYAQKSRSKDAIPPT